MTMSLIIIIELLIAEFCGQSKILKVFQSAPSTLHGKKKMLTCFNFYYLFPYKVPSCKEEKNPIFVKDPGYFGPQNTVVLLIIKKHISMNNSAAMMMVVVEDDDLILLFNLLFILSFSFFSIN